MRGKTLNQNKFHLKQIDQFYWQADAHTLLGHQMPIAIVGMRPERQVAEPNSFWDHGLIREFCPSEEPRVLGDSDDFLMVELREKDVAQEQIASGPADPRDAGERMIGWVTPYQRSFAPYQLTLHSQGASSQARRRTRHTPGTHERHIVLLPGLFCHRTGSTHNGTITLGRSWRHGTSTFRSASASLLKPISCPPTAFRSIAFGGGCMAPPGAISGTSSNWSEYAIIIWVCLTSRAACFRSRSQFGKRRLIGTL